MRAPLPDPGDGVLDAVLHDPDTDLLLDGRAFIAAMLQFEAALAEASAAHGIVPADAADRIAAACRTVQIEPSALRERTKRTGSPVVPLVEQLSAALGDDQARRWVHFGATTQDTLDTATALVANQVVTHVRRGLAIAASWCARVSKLEADTLMIGRTMGQQAQPITFGLKTAGWCIGLWDAADRLGAAAQRRTVQLGGAAGTLATLGDAGPAVVAELGRRLGLAVPPLPWHTNRSQILELAAGLASVTAAWSKIATDVTMLAQTEIGELSEDVTGGGRSSAMPHKRNPAMAISVRAGGLRVPGLLGTVYAAASQENERGIGSYQAEWVPLRELLRLAGALTTQGQSMLAALVIDRAAMARNLSLTGGLIMSEAVASALAPDMGRVAAHALMSELVDRAVSTGTSLRDISRMDSRVRAIVDAAEVDRLLDPRNGVGPVHSLIDAAMAVHRDHLGEWPDLQ